MRRLLRLGALVVTTAALTACASAMDVGSHVDRALDFSAYRTYDWGPADALPTGDPRLDQNALFKDRVQGAVERQLAARGIQLVTGGAPDLLIHYHASITEKLDINRADRTYGYCAGEDCPPDTIASEAGTLVIDFMDARTDKLVWRGWATNSVKDLLGDPDEMARTIDEAVQRMLAQLPASLRR
ncbi:MAG: DUF4136 domain-containing protein [Vicinamibacterales bacterium]